MSKSFIPRSDDALVIWYNNFSAGLATYSGQCDITPVDVGNTQKDAKAVEAVVKYQAQLQAYAEAFTALKDALIEGVPKGSPTTPLAWPVAPAQPDPMPTLVSPGARKRAQDTAAQIKVADGYTDTIGEALGIIAPKSDEERPEDMKPDPKIKGLSAGHPVIRCSLGGADLVEIEGDHADAKGWVHVGTMRRAQMTDMFLLPLAGTAQVWRYRAIFHDASGRIGQWSDVITVTVVGV